MINTITTVQDLPSLWCLHSLRKYCRRSVPQRDHFLATQQEFNRIKKRRLDKTKRPVLR